MSSNFAAKLWPYATYFLYFEVVILCLALLTLAVLLLRRVWSKQPFEGDPAYTREKIAFELTAEITRLRDLRNRVYPGFADEAEKVPAAGPSVAAAAPAVDVAALEQEISKKFQEQIAALQAQLKEAQEAVKQAAANAAAATPSAGPASEELTKAKAALEQEQGVLRSKVETLEKTLMEYQIFEQDIALVKKYKNENEELRRQLSSTPQVTEEDIASLFSAMTGPEKGGAAPAPAAAAPAPTPEPALAPTPAPAPAAASFGVPQEEPQSSAPADDLAALEAMLASSSKPTESSAPSSSSNSNMLSEDDINAAFAAMTGSSPAPSQESAPGFLTDNAKEPSVGLTGSINPEDIEAFAETAGDSGGQDDKIMAEFQKILGGDKS